MWWAKFALPQPIQREGTRAMAGYDKLGIIYAPNALAKVRLPLARSALEWEVSLRACPKKTEGVIK